MTEVNLNISKKSTKLILMLGNLQSGKTMLFRRLCAGKFKEMEIPQTSQTLERGLLKDFKSSHGLNGEMKKTFLLDTPGTSTLFPQGEEEMVSRDAILQLNPDVLLLVADAKNMRRSLALCIQAAEFQIPTVLAVNMEDEAWRHGIDVDVGMLSSLLGIDVVSTVATQGIGIRKLLGKLQKPRIPKRISNLPPHIESSLNKIASLLDNKMPINARALSELLLIEDDTARRLVKKTLGVEKLEKVDLVASIQYQNTEIGADVIMTEARYKTAGLLTNQVVSKREVRGAFSNAVGKLAHHPIWGFLIALLVIYAMYLWVGKLGATLVVDSIKQYVFDNFLIPKIENITSQIPWPLVREALMDQDFGILPTGIFLAFGLVMPVLFFFYFAFNILHSSGYIARLSILLDRIFRIIGLNGKGILPLTMGFSCVTMALITTRMLDSKRERIISSFLLLLGTPCAPLLAMMMIVLGALPVTATVTVFGIILSQGIFAGILARKLLKGHISDFVMVIPPMRFPRMSRVLKQTARQIYYFMKEAVPLFIFASLIMFTIDKLGGLDLLEKLGRPVVNGMLGLPDESLQVFIKTLIRRETGATELDLVRSGFSNVQVVVTLLVMTFLTPCINSVIVLIKEQGFKTATAMILIVSSYAILVGAVLNATCQILGITFT